MGTGQSVESTTTNNNNGIASQSTAVARNRRESSGVPITIAAASPTRTANESYQMQQDQNNNNSSNNNNNDNYNKNNHNHPKNISMITMDPTLLTPLTDWNSEIHLLLSLAVPTIIIQLGVVLPNVVIASQVGRLYGSIYLDGFAVANLMGNLCNLSLLQGIYTASDTLGPQAYGAKNYRQVGLLSIRGAIVSIVVLLPINVVLVGYFQRMMTTIFHQPNADVAHHGQQYYRVFVVALPFYVLYNVTWKFLSSQEVMRPLLVVCLFCCFVVLPVGIYSLFHWFGFIGSALTIVLFQSCQSLLLLLYLKLYHPHTEGTWPGLSWSTLKEAIGEPKGAFTTYVWLGLGGMLATSEWIYWESLTLLIGTMGVVPLSVHTIPTQVREP
jgi:MATE family multidrug resistance protein